MSSTEKLASDSDSAVRENELPDFKTDGEVPILKPIQSTSYRLDGRCYPPNATMMKHARKVHCAEQLTHRQLKLSQRSGKLNLSGQGYANIPAQIFMMNDDMRAPQTSTSASDKRVPLQELILMGNSITALPPEISFLHTLTLLSLEKNKLYSVPEQIGQLKQLHTLNLSHNNLQELPSQIFTLPELRNLNLSHNNIEELHPDISNLYLLEKLDISGNILTVLPAGLGFLVRVTHFNVSKNQLTELPPDCVNLRDLLELDVSENLITVFPLYMGSLSRLKILKANDNQISYLPDLDGCVQLESLLLCKNRLVVLSGEFCSQFPHLQTLDLSHNFLENLPTNFDLLQCLIYLDISNNNISVLPATIGLLAHLREFKVSGNPIKSLRRDVLSCGVSRILRTLRAQAQKQGCNGSIAAAAEPNPLATADGKHTFNIAYEFLEAGQSHSLSMVLQNLTSVPDRVFEAAADHHRTLVDFSKNRLNTLPNGLTLLKEIATELNFSNNMLSQIPELIADMQLLTSINFSCNNLRALPPEFGALAQLRVLNLSHNRFQVIPDCIYELPILEVLLMPNNCVKKIDASARALGVMKSLKSLDLRNNEIEVVPPELGNLRNITNLDIVGNPFRLPRQQILDKGTEAIMSFLRDRIPA